MHRVMRYGRGPYRAAVVHGGPGAAGEVAEVARELSSCAGVLEPLQTADTVTGQVEELRNVLEENAALPVTLIGFSWGAWLCTILAARHPHCVSKLVLVSSGPFDEKDASGIMETRLSRLKPSEREEAESLMASIAGTSDRTDADLERFGELMSTADAYAPIPERGDPVPPSLDIYRRVWSEALKMRNSGELLRLAGQVRCPVVAIHGDYDPHPAASIASLEGVFREFRFILLEKCGHHPWLERHARQQFFATMNAELNSPCRPFSAPEVSEETPNT